MFQLWKILLPNFSKPPNTQIVRNNNSAACCLRKWIRKCSLCNQRAVAALGKGSSCSVGRSEVETCLLGTLPYVQDVRSYLKSTRPLKEAQGGLWHSSVWSRSSLSQNLAGCWRLYLMYVMVTSSVSSRPSIAPV